MLSIYPNGTGLFQDAAVLIRRARGLMNDLLSMKLVLMICSEIHNHHILTYIFERISFRKSIYIHPVKFQKLVGSVIL